MNKLSRNSRRSRIAGAACATIETLENRQLMSGDVVAFAAVPGATGGPATVTGVAGTNLTLSRGALVMNAVRGQTSLAAKLTLSNGGTSSVTVSGLSLGGTEPGSFQVTAGFTGTLAPGASATVSVVYKPAAATSLGIHTATLNIASNDPTMPSIAVPLRGLATQGTGGQNEPSLQRLYDLYQLGIATGDKNAADTNLFSPSAPLGANDEVVLQKLTKAGTGNVSIQTLATFAGGSPAANFGFYTAGSPGSKTQLLSTPSSGAQSVNPGTTGSTSFDPGASTFGLYASFPIFSNTAFSEDNLNSGESVVANRRKVRFYPLKNSDGSAVPNAYVFTTEDFFNDPTGGYDDNDFIGIIRNVKPAASTGGLTLTNLDGVPYDDRIVVSRIGVQPPAQLKDANGNLYSPPPNVQHDTASIVITNGKSTAITINSLALSNASAWKITAGPAAGTVLQPGASATITIKFVATVAPATTVNETIDLTGFSKSANGTYVNTLTINTSDPASNKTVTLAGYFQKKNEQDQEPNLQTIVNKMFGYKTTILNPGQKLAQGGAVSAVGEEVLSNYWTRADTSSSVSVRQLAAYHTQGDTATLFWTSKATGVQKTVTIHNGVDAQSILPRNTAGGPAAGTFSPDGQFSLKVANESTIDSANKQEQPGGGFGHHVRMFPVRDRNGVIVPNTFLLTMDYLAKNYDYQDNVYLISNIKPVSTVVTPTGPVLAGLTLKNAATNTNIKPFVNGTVIDTTGGKQYTVEANPGTGTLGSVVFAIDGVVVRTETTPPFTIAGDASATDNNPWAVPLGAHTMTVTPYSGAGGTGAAGPTITVDFTATGTSPTLGVTSLTLVNAVTNADIGPITNGMTIDFSGGKQYSVRANIAGATKSVVFKVDATTVRTESTAPFTIAGDNPISGGTDYLPWTVSNGAHTLVATGFSATGGTGTAGSSVTLNITVTGAGSVATGAGTFTGANVNGATGSTTAGATGAWTVKGSGTGLAGTLDQFHFANQARNGDFDVKVQLSSLTAGGTAGLVARGATSGGNSEAAVLFSGGKIFLGSRAAFGAAYTSSQVGTGTAGTLWLRMKRVGSVFTVFYGTNGTTWTTGGSVTVSALPAGILFGFGVFGPSQATAQFTNAAG